MRPCSCFGDEPCPGCPGQQDNPGTALVERQHYLADLTLFDGPRTPCSEAEANLVSSEVPGGAHAPVIDLDFPCRLIPSTTEGHFHLYLDREVPWPAYLDVLRAMCVAGLVEPGVVMMAERRGATFVRKPGVPKLPGDSNSTGVA